MSDSHRRYDSLGTLALFITVLAWGSIPVFLRSFIHELDGWTANGTRYGVSALFWLGPLVYWWRKGEIQIRHVWAILPILVINLFGQSLWAWAPYYLEAGMMGFMVRISTIFSVLASFLLFPQERPLARSSRFWLGLFLMVAGFIGMALLGEEMPQGATLKGLIIILSCGFFWGMYAVSVRYCVPDLPPHHAFSLICTVTAIPLIGMMFMWGDIGSVGAMTPWRIFLLLFSGILGIAFAHVSYYLSIQRLGVAIGSSANLLAPLVTLIVAFFVFGETLTAWQILSGFLLLGGAGFLISAQVHIIRVQS